MFMLMLFKYGIDVPGYTAYRAIVVPKSIFQKIFHLIVSDHLVNTDRKAVFIIGILLSAM